MTKQITTYTANVTGISANNPISSASEITARQNTAIAINNTGEVVGENRKLLEAIHTSDHIINVISTSFSGGTNELSILADAITWWDESVYRADKTANAALTGWPAKTITGLTTSNSFYIWATFVSGTKDYEATNRTAALPSDLTEKALIGIATVNGSGVVTLAVNWQGPNQTKENYFRDTQYFLGNIIIPPRTFSGTSYTALLTDSIIRYTGTANATLSLPTAVGNGGKRYRIINSSTTQGTRLTTDPDGSETINGSPKWVSFPNDNDYFDIMSDNANWIVIDRKDRVLMESWTPTAVASKDFAFGTDINDKQFKAYEIIGTDVNSSVTSVLFSNRFSIDGGLTFLSTSIYNRGDNQQEGVAVGGTGSIDSFCNIANAYAASSGLSFSQRINNPLSSYNVKQSITQATGVNSTGSTIRSNISQVNILTASPLNGIQMLVSSGTFLAGGNISVYGLRG